MPNFCFHPSLKEGGHGKDTIDPSQGLISCGPICKIPLRDLGPFGLHGCGLFGVPCKDPDCLSLPQHAGGNRAALLAGGSRDKDGFGGSHGGSSLGADD